MAFSPDMGQLASASSDGTIRFWDTEMGKLQWTVQEHSGYNNSIAFSPNGRRLASASSDYTVGLWDVAQKILQAKLERHSNVINCVVFSPTGQLLASASDDRTICVWNTGTASLHREFGGHTAGVTSVAFSPDGQRLASASRDCTVRIWTVKESSQKTLISGSTEVNSLAFSSDGCMLATASRGRTVRIWDATTGALQREFKCHIAGIKSLTSSYKGQQSSHTNSARVRDTAIETSTRSAPLDSGPWQDRGAGSRQHQAAAQSSFQTARHQAPGVRPSKSLRADGRLYAKPDQQESIYWGPSRSNGTSRQYQGAAPIVSSTTPQEPHRGSYRGSYGGPQPGPQPWTRGIDNIPTSGPAQDVTVTQRNPISWRGSPRGGRRWQHPMASASSSRHSMPEALPKQYDWGPSRGHRNTQSTSRIPREDCNGQSRRPQNVSSASKTPREDYDGHLEIHKLSFGNDGTYLITDIGIMKLEDSPSGTIPWPSFALDIEGSWITHKGEKVLLLPTEYRPVCQDFRDGVIALGSSSGRVTILRVDRVLQDARKPSARYAEIENGQSEPRRYELG